MENNLPSEDQVLLDLLAKKTQLYTKALVGGTEDLSALRTSIDTLIAEIKTRKRDRPVPPEELRQMPFF